MTNPPDLELRKRAQALGLHGLFVHLHALVTDGAFEERGGEVRFMPASTPTPERLTAVLAQVHKAVAAVTGDDDLDMDRA